MKAVVAILIGMFLLISIASADDNAPKFSGYMFGDFYWFASSHNPDLQDRNGFWFRRIYFTMDKDLSEAFSMRFRLEMANPDGLTKGAGTAVPFVKDAYLKWKTGNHQLILGISPTPTWEVIEKVWGYRSVEKTPLDLHKFGSSRDFGIAAKGKLDSQGLLKYHLMLANGNSNKSENNKGKKVLLAVDVQPNDQILVEFYGDWNDLPGDEDVLTLQGFLALKGEKGRLGAQFAQQIYKQSVGEDIKLEIGSVFAVLSQSEKVNFFARVDRLFDPSPANEGISYLPFDARAKATFFVGGVDFMPISSVHLMPNVEVIIYDENEQKFTPEKDIVPRLTFYYKF